MRGRHPHIAYGKAVTSTPNRARSPPSRSARTPREGEVIQASVKFRSLAHLNGLRAFDAVARTASVVRAAEALGVTPGAVSQQLRLLQAYYGLRLVQRHGRALRLTDAGQALAGDLRDAFDQLDRAVRRLAAPGAPARLRVSAPPTLAARWLVGRLGGFRDAHPDIAVEVIASDRVVDLRREPIDVAVRYGPGPWPGLRQQRLGAETLTPACSRGYLARRPLRTPPDLFGTHLIEDATLADVPGFPTWATWFAQAGLDALAPPSALSVSSSLLAVQAAVDGLGVILARSFAVADDLARGRLVEPFGGVRASGWAYHLVAPPEAFARPKVQAFATWLARVFVDEAPERCLPRVS